MIAVDLHMVPTDSCGGRIGGMGIGHVAFCKIAVGGHRYLGSGQVPDFFKRACFAVRDSEREAI